MEAKTVTQYMRMMHGDPESAFQQDLGYLASRIREHAVSVRMHQKQRRKLLDIADQMDVLVRVAGHLDVPEPDGG